MSDDSDDDFFIILLDSEFDSDEDFAPKDKKSTTTNKKRKEKETKNEIDDEFMIRLADSIGPGSKYAKEYAEETGNALFAKFMEELYNVPDCTPLKAMIIGRAEELRYHDFEGDLMKVGLSVDLRKAGLIDLAKRVEKGEFDF